jgi:hypothetical protein
MKRRLALGAVLLAAAVSAHSQEKPGPLVQVAVFKPHFGKTGLWLDHMKKLYVPLLERLTGEGTVLAYGIDLDILHNAGAPNASAWFVTADYAAHEKVLAGIQEAQQKNPTAMQAMLEVMDMEQHHDYLFRVLTGNGKPVAAGSHPFTTVSIFKAKPGKSEALQKAFEKYYKGVFDKLVADGAIHSYSLLRESVHSTDPATLWFVMSAPNLAAQDKMREAFQADYQKRSEVERSAIEKEFEELGDESAHRDFLMRSEVYASQ